MGIINFLGMNLGHSPLCLPHPPQASEKELSSPSPSPYLLFLHFLFFPYLSLLDLA